MISLAQFWDRLNKHDWYYEFSDDGRVFRAGTAENAALLAIAKKSAEHQALFDAFKESKKFGGGPRPPRPASEHDWLEDAEHENGKYMNTCVMCKETFVGHKCRVACKVCSKKP